MKWIKSILVIAIAVQTASAEGLDGKKAEQPGYEDLVAKEVIGQWVATERLLGQEAADWKLEKARMSELLELYSKELTLLNEELEESGAVATTVNEKKIELEKKVADSKAKRLKLKSFLGRLSPRVINLVKKFPVPLQEQLVGDVAVLNDVNDETSVRELLQAVVNVIEAGGNFNRGIYQNKQTVNVAGEEINADVIYLGLGRAFFYVGKKAGIGVPTAAGWEWERKDEIIDEVVKAVEVFKKTNQPQLVELPLKLEVVK